MLFRLDYVPTRFDEAVQEVLRGVTPEERAQMLALNSSELSPLHFAFGRQMRFAWSLWDTNTPLANDCKARGLPTNPDDLAMGIIQEAWAEICGG